MRIHRPAAIISILLALCAAVPAHAEDRQAGAASGFYGGVSLRDRGTEAAGLTFGSVNSVWNRYVAPVADDATPRTLVFGGYRWRNDIAVEASFNTADQYALRPAEGLDARRGVGLNFGSSPGIGEPQTRSWNVDVFTSWNFYRAFALYGRLGYGQSDATPAFTGAPPATADIRRLRDGVNYGLGLRYDMTSALGLRLEYGRYGRFGRFAGEIGTGLPETDQVSFGVQFRF
jgi:opacity protein-like surface antigen